MDPSPYAGAGGKIRRRPPPRASATPYDRPPAAAAAHRLAAAAAAASSGPSAEGGGGSSGWVSRLVDPASRLLAGGAARLFSSVFRKRLGAAPAQAPPLSSASGRSTEPKQDTPESTYVNSSPVLKDGMEKEKKPAGSLDDKALSEVEHLLMKKTFNRVEFDRLTDILRARTVEYNLSTSMVSQEEKNEGSARTNEPRGSTLQVMAANYSPTAKVHSHGADSPAELAKQYMSSRYSREPQSSSLRSRLFLENKGEASNIAYDKRSGQPHIPERIEFGNENPGLPVNGYATPGLRGRSAIYRMSCSPYFKGPSSSSDVSVSSLSQRAQSLHAGGRPVLKRRAADLENEHGSIGPIRRIRQKSNMMSSFRHARANPRESLLAGRTTGSGFTEDSSSIQESPSSKRLLLGTGQFVQPLDSHKDGDVKSTDTVPPIPPQSNRMAEKIFEQLNIIAPSPKEKQSGKQSVANNSSPSMLKEPVLLDNGPSSMGDPSSSLKFHDLDGVNEPLDQESSGSKKGKLKLTNNDGSSKVASPDKPTILGNLVSAAKSRKPGFKMVVLEDLPEFDDDLEEPIPSNNVGTNEQKFDSSNRKEQKVEQKVGPNLLKENVGSPVSERPTAPVSKTVYSSGLLSPNDPGKTDTACATAENNTGFTFSHVPPGTCTGSTTSALPAASVKDNKQIGASTSIFGLKQSSTSDLETSTAADVKNNAGLFQSATKPTALGSTSSEKGNKRERAEDAVQPADKVLPSAASTTLNAPLPFASTASSSPSLSNGFSYSSSPKVTPADKPALSASTSIFAAPSSSPAISSSTPSSPAFTFGSSTSVGSSIAAPVKSETAEAKPASTLTFGIRGATAEAKSTAPDSTSKSPSKLLSSPVSSNISTFSSSPTSSTSIFSSVSTISSSLVSASSVAASTTTTTAPLTLTSSGIFGFSTPAQSTGLSTSVAPSISQPPTTNAVFGSKPPQSEAAVSRTPQSSVAQFGSSFPTSGGGASSSGSGTVSFGVGPSSAGSGTMSFGVGTSSSAPGTVAFGATASSSGPGILSFAAGTSSSGSGTVSFGLGAGATSSGPGGLSFGAGATSSGPGTVSFGAGAASSGPGAVSFGVGVASSAPGTASFGSGTASTGPGMVSFGVGSASSGPGTVSFGVPAASSGSGTFSFGAGAASSGSGTLSFGAGASSSGPGTVSFGATTSASGSGFGNSQFGAGSTFSTPFNSSSGTGTGFAFSPPISSALSSTVASTSVFSSSSAGSSTSSFSNPFGSSSSASSTFAFGQSASSGGGFSFGAQSAPAFSSQGPVFSFNSASTSMNSSTPQPAFGLTNTNTGFGTGNDQMNDDSMADDTNQAAPTPAPIFGSSPFGQQGNSPAAPVFGAPSVQPSGVFQFGGQQQGSAPQNPAFPPPGGSLEFQGGGFSLGSGGAGGDKSNRRVIKVKRAPKKR